MPVTKCRKSAGCSYNRNLVVYCSVLQDILLLCYFIHFCCVFYSFRSRTFQVMLGLQICLIKFIGNLLRRALSLRWWLLVRLLFIYGNIFMINIDKYFVYLGKIIYLWKLVLSLYLWIFLTSRVKIHQDSCRLHISVYDDRKLVNWQEQNRIFIQLCVDWFDVFILYKLHISV